MRSDALFSVGMSLWMAGCAAPGEEPSRALPSGVTTWAGEGLLNGETFTVELELDNDGCDLSGVSTLVHQPSPGVPDQGRFVAGVSGTCDPRSGRVALAPTDFLEEADPTASLVGWIGELVGDTLDGAIVDASSPALNVDLGGESVLERLSGDGEPPAVGDGSKALDAEGTFSGDFRCANATRPTHGELSWLGDGRVEGWNAWAETEFGVDDIGTYPIYGVHNPDTGAVTLMPGAWTELVSGNYANNWLDGVWNPDDRSYVATVRVTRGGCLDDLFVVTFD